MTSVNVFTKGLEIFHVTNMNKEIAPKKIPFLSLLFLYVHEEWGLPK